MENGGLFLPIIWSLKSFSAMIYIVTFLQFRVVQSQAMKNVNKRFNIEKFRHGKAHFKNSTEKHDNSSPVLAVFDSGIYRDKYL